MAKTALITGASSGIGRELAKYHAAQGGDLVIVARRKAALDELKSELESKHGISVTCIAMDLIQSGAADLLYKQVENAGIQVDYLINNAGFGGHGYFHEREWAQDEAMIQLNVTTLTELTRRFLPGMVSRDSGRVLNVASTAGFIPGPLQAVYYATKAFVNSLSQAIDEEMRHLGKDVTVTALCPGAVDTEFAESANLDGVDAFKSAKSPASVAQVGYEAMLRGDLIAINEFNLKFLIGWILPLLPRRTVLRISRKSMQKSN